MVLIWTGCASSAHAFRERQTGAKRRFSSIDLDVDNVSNDVMGHKASSQTLSTSESAETMEFPSKHVFMQSEIICGGLVFLRTWSFSGMRTWYRSIRLESKLKMVSVVLGGRGCSMAFEELVWTAFGE